MSTIDLFLLGLHMDRSWNAYELVKMLDTFHLGEMIRISTPAVYKNLIRLTDKGFLSVEKRKEGGSPEKKIYTISDTGRKRFRELMFAVAGEDVKFHIDQNTCLVNLHHLNRADALDIMEKIMENLKRKQEMFLQAIPRAANADVPFTALEVAGQIKSLNTIMLQWLELFKRICEEK
jgi:DNA-binding PadR family transcriptional regulator